MEVFFNTKKISVLEFIDIVHAKGAVWQWNTDGDDVLRLIPLAFAKVDYENDPALTTDLTVFELVGKSKVIARYVILENQEQLNFNFITSLK